MRDENRYASADQLVDIRDVKIDSSLPTEERIKSFVEQIRDPYQFKIGSTVVHGRVCEYTEYTYG